MSISALGTWRNPPLAYVVAELVISPYYSLGAAIPGLQDKLRVAYPRTVEGQELVVDGPKPTPQPLWRLMSADQTQGLQFGTRAISLHATSYVDSKDFLGRWAAVLDVIDAANLGAFVERAGLRYIDLIVPSSERTPAEYLDRGLRGVVPSGAVSVGSMWAAEFQIDGVSVNLRAAAPAPPGLLFPPDFNALPLTKPSILVEAEKRLKEQKPIGFIDTDCLKDVRRLFGASDLVGVYSDMQKKVSQTFTTALSPEALEEWK